MPADRNAAVQYVALGDSTVEGVGATSADLNYVSRLQERLRAEYPTARVVNLGAGGATSADVVRRQLDRAIALRPDLVTLSIGPNDITTRVPLAAYERNLDTILGRLRHETTALAVVNLIPDLTVTPRFRAHRARDAVGRQTVLFNEALERQGRRARRRAGRSLHREPARGSGQAGAHRGRRLSPVRRGVCSVGRARVDGGPGAHRREVNRDLVSRVEPL